MPETSIHCNITVRPRHTYARKPNSLIGFNVAWVLYKTLKLLGLSALTVSCNLSFFKNGSCIQSIVEIGVLHEIW